MRLVLVASLLLGCSSPVIVVLPPDQPDTSASDTASAVDTSSPPADATGSDTGSAPVDSETVDTAAADATLDTGVDTGPEVCTPLDASAACPALPSGLPACGPAPDGCGGKGKVDCGACASPRRCAATAADPVPHCTCTVVPGTCVLYSGLFGTKVKCLALDAPLAEGSTLIPQPDGTITMYCVP